MLDGRVLGASQVEYKHKWHQFKCHLCYLCSHSCRATCLRRSLPGRATCPALKPRQVRAPCYMCYMCYILHAKPPNLHSPPGPCYMCYMCYILHAKPLNIHSPPGPCYMCYMGLTRQAAEPPLSPSSLLYVLYVLYILYALQNVVYVLYNAYLVHVEMLCV